MRVLHDRRAKPEPYQRRGDRSPGDAGEQLGEVSLLVEREGVQRLRVPKSGVELEQEWTLRGQHEPSVEDATERKSLGAHRLGGPLDDLEGPIALRASEEREQMVALRVRPHASVFAPASFSRARL